MKSLEEELDEALGLAPPRAPIISEETVIVRKPQMDRSQLKVDPAASKPIIDFNNMPNTYWTWCDRLETKRTWYHARFDKVHRGTVESLKKDVEERDDELDIVKQLKKQQKPLFSAVMNEFKTKLERIKK